MNKESSACLHWSDIYISGSRAVFTNYACSLANFQSSEQFLTYVTSELQYFMPEPPVQKHLCAVYSLWWQASTKAK
jgi:hypothetical protein